MARPKTLKATVPSLWRMLRYFWPYTKKYYLLITGSFLALFAAAIFRILEPWPLKFIFDLIIMPSNTTESLNWASLRALDPFMILIITAVGLILITGLRALMTYYNRVGFALVGNRVLTEVRTDLYKHLQCLSLSFHSKTRSGDLITRVIGDIGLLKDVMVTALMPLIGSALILTLMLGMMFWLHWKLTLIVLLTLPLYWLPSVRLGRKIRDVSRKQRKREGAIASNTAEVMGAIKVVQTLSLEETFSKAFSSQNQKSLKEGVKAKRLAARLQGTVQVMIALSTALVLWYGTRLVLLGQLTPGSLLVFLSYLKGAFKPMQDFAKYTSRLAKAAAAGERVLDIFEKKLEIVNKPNAIIAPTFHGMVQFNKVSFAYEKDQLVLDELSIDVKPKQQVAIVGTSGNGKSTLLSLISRLYEPSSGRVLIDGHDIRDYTLESLRQQISVVLQDNLLFAGSIRDNITLGSKKVSDEDIETAARLANAHDFIIKFPEGYNTSVSERGVTLSAGQRQRIAIARAAIRKAPIILLDEPTTGLDEANEQEVIEALEKLTQNSTTFLVTHNLKHAARADIIVFLDNGRIVEQGTHEELLRLDRFYAKLYYLETQTKSNIKERTYSYAY